MRFGDKNRGRSVVIIAGLKTDWEKIRAARVTRQVTHIEKCTEETTAVILSEYEVNS